MTNTAGKIATVATAAGLTAKMVGEIADPLADCYVSALDVETKETPTYDNESTAETLSKIAGLLPAAVMAVLAVPEADDMAA